MPVIETATATTSAATTGQAAQADATMNCDLAPLVTQRRGRPAFRWPPWLPRARTYAREVDDTSRISDISECPHIPAAVHASETASPADARSPRGRSSAPTTRSCSRRSTLRACVRAGSEEAQPQGVCPARGRRADNRAGDNRHRDRGRRSLERQAVAGGRGGGERRGAEGVAARGRRIGRQTGLADGRMHGLRSALTGRSASA
jgi:hypothetical protein